MRTIIDLPEEQIEALAEICEREDRSRASLIREAIGIYLTQRRVPPERAFGLWKGRPGDGLSYQEALRSEWDERESVGIGKSGA